MTHIECVRILSATSFNVELRARSFLPPYYQGLSWPLIIERLETSG